MRSYSVFALHHYRPRVPYALPMVIAHRIRDLSLHQTSGIIIAFYEDVAPLTVNAEWAQLMQPTKGQYFVTAPKGGTLLLNSGHFEQLFVNKETPNVRTERPAISSTAKPAGSCKGQCSGCRSHG